VRTPGRLGKQRSEAEERYLRGLGRVGKQQAWQQTEIFGRSKVASAPLERTLGGRLEHRQDFTSALIVSGRKVLRSLAASRHGIGARLLNCVLLISSFVTVILTALQLYADYRRDVADVESRLERIGGAYLDSLAEGLWNLDERQLRLQLDALLRLPDIRGVEIRETGSAGKALLKVSRDPEDSTFAREYPLHYSAQGQDRVIGTLRVEATLAGVYRRLANTASTILLTQAATIFLVSLFMLFFFHHLVTRHLYAIAADIGSHRIKDAPLKLHLRRLPPRHEDELQRVVTAFNALSHNLYTAYRDLAERENRIRRLVDSNIIGIFIWNIDGRIIEANEAFLQMVGFDREDLASGRVNRTDLTPMEWRERDARTVAEAKATGTVHPFEKEYLRKDGSRIPVLIGVTAFDDKRDQGVGFVLDLTERKRAAETLHEMQMALTHTTRIATMGQLTASIAHEVSQPITATIINARAGLRWLAADPPDIDEVRQALKGIIQDGERAGDVLGRIRGLVKKGPTRKDIIAINDVIVDVIALTRSELLGHRVSLQTNLAAGLPRIKGDRVQLQQVVLNLILNAVEAMEDNNAAARELWISSKMDGENRVLVAVRDTGSGLDLSKVDRLFEPFYTTKAEGIGIGLSLSRTIIEAHGGRLWASTNEPRGAIFQFTVPAHSDDA